VPLAPVPAKSPEASVSDVSYKGFPSRRQQILKAIQRWVQETGAPPAAIDWDPARARATGKDGRAQRFVDGAYPNVAVVRRHFGSWNAAIRAAGYEPHAAPARIRGHRGRDAVLFALGAWHDLYGAPPTMADWEPSRARRLGQPWRVERYAAGDWPSMRTVRYHFGTLKAAVEAAGLTPREAGRRTAAAVWVEREAWVRRAQASAALNATTLAVAVRAVADARTGGEGQALRSALVDLAVTALRWAETLPSPDGASSASEPISGLAPPPSI